MAESEGEAGKLRKQLEAAERRAEGFRKEADTAKIDQNVARTEAKEAIALGLRAATETDPVELVKIRRELRRKKGRVPSFFHVLWIWGGRALVGLGVPLSLLTYLNNSFKDADDRFREAYVKLGDSYNDIIKSCAENPDLDCYDMTREEIDRLYGLSPAPPCGPNRSLRQQVIYSRLLNHFEQAYTLLDSRRDWVPIVRGWLHLLPRHSAADVWPGWEKYIYSYLKRPAFRHHWAIGSSEWSGTFKRYMDCLCESAQTRPEEKASDVFARCDDDPMSSHCETTEGDRISLPSCTSP